MWSQKKYKDHEIRFSGCLFLENTQKLRNLTYYAVVLILGRVTESELSDKKNSINSVFFIIIIEDSFYSNYKELIKKKLIKKF